MSIQLPARSLRFARGITEDVLVNVDKLIFPIDFVILDIDEDIEMHLILGQPFLIDVREGKLVLKVRDEKIIFKISNAMNHSHKQNDTCYFLDAIIIVFQFYARNYA